MTGEEVDSFIAEYHRLKVANRRAYFVIALANNIDNEAVVVSPEMQRWWEGLTSVAQARLIVEAGGTAW